MWLESWKQMGNQVHYELRLHFPMTFYCYHEIIQQKQLQGESFYFHLHCKIEESILAGGYDSQWPGCQQYRKLRDGVFSLT